jgi:RNA polymerase sigma-70 factor (ECF subfamily)
MFAVPFEEIAPILGRSVDASRQLASRARRRVQGAPVPEIDLSRQRGIVDAFLKASREGNFEGLLAVLDPDVVFRADQAAVRLGSLPEIRGAEAVAQLYKGRARAARTALVDGEMGVAVILGGQLRIALRVTFAGERIGAIEAVADAEELAGMEVAVLDGSDPDPLSRKQPHAQ